MLAYDNTHAEAFFATLDPKIITRRKHELQFDFFLSEKESEIDRLIRMTEEIKDSTGKVRRKLFSENSQLKKRVLELEERLSIIEKGLCHGNILVCS
jgi:hypothetical protein